MTIGVSEDLEDFSVRRAKLPPKSCREKLVTQPERNQEKSATLSIKLCFVNWQIVVTKNGGDSFKD